MNESTTCVISYSSVDPGRQDAMDGSNPTVPRPTLTDGLSTPGMTPQKCRSYDADGIPSDAIRNTATHIWMRDKQGRVYKHRHGFKSTYSVGCHCEPCHGAMIYASRAYAKATKVGGRRYTGDEVRAHMAMLATEKFMGARALSRVSGVQEGTLRRIKNGKMSGTVRLQPPKRVLPRIAEAILAVTGDEEVARRPADHVPIDLTTRRLQSLAALGYSQTAIRRMLGNRLPSKGGDGALRVYMHTPGERQYIRMETAVAVRDLYREIGDTPAIENGCRKSSVTVALRQAREKGWQVPATWDDPGTPGGSLDEEAAPIAPIYVDTVLVERVATGDDAARGLMNHAERAEVVRTMLARGSTQQEVIDMLHLSSQTFARILSALENGEEITPRLKDRCAHGHLYTPENTYVHRGSRKCRTCRTVERVTRRASE